MVEVAPILDPFIARPPTPPRESSSKLLRDTAFLYGASTQRSLLDTPEDSPASSAEYFKDSSGKARKKVGFSGWTQYHQPGPIGLGGFGSGENRKRLPPSRECNPTKPILKRYTDVSSVESKENIPTSTGDLPAMLRSAASHLAGGLRSSKIDAYNSLLGCLNAYDDVPNSQELVEKVVEIAGYIRRDILTKGIDGATDAQLAAQALKLITVLLYTKGTANLIPEDFCSFIFEQSIKCMEDPTTPKILVSHYMHLLEKQKFSQKILTPERLSRLLSVLVTITPRVKGNRVACQRLNIYHRLLTQAKSLMISRTGSWIDHLISGMLSSIKDVRARAIAFGMEAGLQVGTVISVSQDCISAFNRQSPEGMKVVEFVEARLKDMTKSREDGLHVPQIWIVILLLLRGRPQQIERWEHLKLWLGILQQCFNSSDAQIKFQANIAWNRFIFAVDLSISTSLSLAKMLKQPIVSQLERKSTDKSAKQAKQIARSSYCTLLHYALRPAATHAQLDHYWDLYVVDLLPRVFAGSQADLEYACDILSNLFFSNSQPKMWDINKGNANGPMKPGDLLPLDPKWLRSKTESIMAIFEKILASAAWDEIENSPLVLLWQNFMSALGNASNKEVKVSMGTMTAIAKILDCLKGFLTPYNTRTTNFDDMKMFTALFNDAVAKIGHIPFNEKRLLLAQSNQFEALAETPSNRGSSKSTSLDSAAAHLIDLLTDTKDGQNSASRQAAFETVVLVTLHNASSRRSRLQILRNIARHSSFDGSTPPTEASLELWASLAKETSASLEFAKTSESHSDSPEYPGHEYRDAVKILELGVRLHSKATCDIWQDLFDCLRRVLSKEVGNAAITFIVHEPLAEVIRTELLSRYDDMIVRHAIRFLKSFQWPGSLKSIEHAQVQLWGVMPMRPKTDLIELLNPYQHVVSAILEATYTSIRSNSEATTISVVSSVVTTINTSPEEYRGQLIMMSQRQIGLWIEDKEGVVTRSSDIYTEVQKLYETVKFSLESSPAFDGSFLEQYNDLFVSCFRSRHKSILNQSILLWNQTVGTASSIDYRQDLQKVLVKLRGATNIHLPTFPDLDDSEDVSSPVNVLDSSESEEEILQRHDTPNKALLVEQRSPRFSTPSRLHMGSPAPASASKGLTHPQSARRDVKTTPKAKLRHDNSQIQFAAIESSPMAEEPEESQRLTDRQKEVKERQKNEAALFPEIRSSPRTALPVANRRLPTLALNSSDIADRLQDDDTISPSFPPDAMMNDFLGSSPTPSSSRKRSQEPYSDEGPPSSPPLIGSHLQIGTTSSASDHQAQADKGEEPQAQMDQVDAPSQDPNPKLPESNLVDGQPAGRAVDSMLNHVISHPSIVNVDNTILSDMEVFVDAPTDHMDATEDMNTTYDSSRSPPPSLASTENDEVTAQLMGEIAEASSQHSRLPHHPGDSAGKVSKKRMAKAADGSRKRKKANFAKDSDSLASSSGEVVADCVLIDSRPRSSGMDTASRPVKQEPDISPEPNRPVGELHEQFRVPGEKRKGLEQTHSEGDKSDGPTSPAKRRARRKGEQDISRRSGRITRTSSRLSDVATSSPIRSEASFVSQEQTGTDAVWVNGPRGSRWAYIPAAAPAPSTDQPPRPLSPTVETTVAHEAGVSPPAVDDALVQPPNREVGQDESAEAPTPSSILEGLRTVLENIKKVTLPPEDERAMVGILFESVHQVHEAGRRHRTL